MNEEIFFTERQRFKQWWLWIILSGVNGLFIFGVIKQVICGQQFGDKPMSNTGLLIATGLTLLLSILFLNFHLDTIIKKDGIYVRFFPFHAKFKYYPWDNLEKCYTRKYSAIAEYGGWGLRLGVFGKGSAYNVSGNMGLQLEFVTQKKLLIGTQKAGELHEVLIKAGQLKQ